jgi:hypothetical protein
MRTNYLKFLSALFALALASAAQAETTNDPVHDCPQIVQFELGDTQFEPGDSITIQEVRGGSDLIQTGGTYCVTGTYTLASQDEADLSFFATTTNRISTPISPRQTMRVKKGTGSFSLIKNMSDDGYLHVTFYSRKTGQGFGGVYFGQGQGVLRDKHFSYHDSATRSAARAEEPVSTEGPNQVLFNFLGNPVAPPANMDPAYTKEGLAQAMKTAAQNAGITLAKLEIDDSEFPFLLGVTFANATDKPKLIEQIRKMPVYATSGGVGGEITYAMNIVPYHAFPPDAAQRIYHRMTLREAVLHEKIVRP